MANIAIVGAGMAGLTALQQLRHANHVIHVFDKSRGSGGRLASKKVGLASWDMGAQFIRSHSAEFAAQIEQWQQQGWLARWPMTPWIIDEDGARPSPDQVDRYVAVPRMTGLSRQLLAADDQFSPSTRIVQCQWQQSQWWLNDEQQQRHGPFDALVINMPPAQAQPLLADSPLLQQQCEVTMQPCWTLLMAFEQDIKAPFDGAFVRTGAIGWLARNNSKHQREPLETWVIQAQHDWSQAHIDSPRELVQQQLTHAFWQALALDPQAPSEQWLHRWLYAICANPLQQGALLDGDKRLSVCGDWCDRGAIEGAWLSGNRAGQWLCKILE